MADLIEVPAEHAERLQQLVDEVLEANARFNLTSARAADEAWIKHITDSLQGLATGLFNGEARVADIGSGGRFPALPLAIVRPDLRWTLIEATRKKCDFLQATAEKFHLNVEIVNQRAETVGHDRNLRARFDLATARAVGTLSEVCELCLPMLKIGGHAVLWRGQRAVEEVQESAAAIKKLGGTTKPAGAGMLGAYPPYELPGHELHYHIVVIEKVAPTPAQFPRRDGLPKQRPL
jgi:16S rRNA (guanine527-N7)-methyltransferase